uniref:FERM, RhoGEF and pleckstrin domain-containing protein 1-like n=1 Tax=Sinocyclocheilus rhinocerous TaxID=307959 RepID=A0A673IX22_9TELE
MVEPEERPSVAGQRLGAPESMGISTLEPGQRPPTMTPGRQVSIRVQMLDDTQEVFEVSQRASGKVLFDLVCAHLNLIEGDYFSLEYQDQRKMTVWLDLLKPILKQIRRPKNTILRFVVKFFPPDHTQLLEELTRYLFALQIKHDLACGRLTCNESSAALLVSHIVQSEIGDFDEVQCKQHLLNNKYIPEQDALMDKIIEYDRKHVGQTPAESDYQLLEIARRLEMYGVRLYPAKDREGTKLSLAVAHSGVLVFQGHTKINAFNWSKVRKLSFKRKRFLIKLRPDLNSSCQDTLEFMMGSRDCCKVFWKICVEYHAFFRLFEEPKPKPKPVLFTRGSSFRFSGRTQRQVIDYVKDTEFKKVPFERSHSQTHDNDEVEPPSHTAGKSNGYGNSQHNGQGANKSRFRESSLTSHWLGQSSDTFTNRCRNGTPDEADTRLKPSPSKQQAEHLSTGLALHAAKGSSSSIPYIDCSDIDSEYDVVKGRFTRSHSQTHDNDEVEPPSHTAGKSNGYGNSQHNGQGASKSRFRVSSLTSHWLGQSSDTFNGSQLSNGSFCGNGSPRALPLSSTLVDELFQGMDRRGLVSPSGPLVGSRSANCSPVMSSFHKTNSLNHPEQIGYSSRRCRDDGNHYLTNGRSGSEPQHYGSYSPIVSRSPHLQKLHNGMRNRSDTNPMILNQLGSTPANEPRSVLSRAERMAALERRVAADGLGTSSQARSSNVQRLYGSRLSANDHNSPVHMIDGSTSSGMESSDTESDAGNNSYSQPLVFGNPGVVNSSPMPQSKFSFGSLQLEDEGQRGEDGYSYPISDEDGAQFFNC